MQDALRVATSRRAHYELTKTVGDIAIAMAALGYDDGAEDLAAFIKDLEWRYPGDDFVMKARYGLWLLAEGGEEAVAFVSDEKKDRGLAMAAVALADLDFKAGLGPVRARASSLAEPVAREVFAEAAARLERQTGAPPRGERMIGLLGRVSSTELALGAETDNVFVQRAREKSGQERLGEVTEADESSPKETQG
ncbi:MAG: hypothetical protein QM765_30625 [Myxococcales bacterium]